jgi:DNA/RNA endonuclease YhcR with UshA esterase domain
VTICGVVSGASYEASVSGKPTFINFDKPYPNHTFTTLIWGDKRDRFNPAAEVQFGSGKRVCVTGLVEMYRGKPEIVVSTPDQIKVC